MRKLQRLALAAALLGVLVFVDERRRGYGVGRSWQWGRDQLRQYVDGKAGAANKKLSPVNVGFFNQQGGPIVIGADATNGAELAVNWANADAGGIDGHPIKLDTCFIASSEAEGTTCGQQFLSIKGLSVIDEGGVAFGVQSLYRTLGGSRPVIAGVAITPRRCGPEARGDPLRRRHARAGAVRDLRQERPAREDRGGRLRGRARHRPERPGLDRRAEGRGDRGQGGQPTRRRRLT